MTVAVALRLFLTARKFAVIASRFFAPKDFLFVRMDHVFLHGSKPERDDEAALFA
jgi:hypothetical protein